MSLLKNVGFSPEEAAQYLELLSAQKSKESQIAASLYYRKKLAACQEPPADLTEKIILELISAIDRPYAEVQLNAAWALTNLACGDRDDTHSIVFHGGIPALMRLVKRSRGGEVRDQAVWALGNLAADCRTCREQVRNSGLLYHIIQCMDTPAYQPLEPRKIIVWCLVNLVRGGMSEISPENVEKLFAQLHQTIEDHEGNEELLCDSLWTIAYIVDHAIPDAERIALAFEQEGLVPKIVSLLKSSSTRVLAGALRAVGNIITGTDEETQRILELGVLDVLSDLVDSEEDQISREALWALSNVAAGTEDHVAQLYSIQGMASKVMMLSRDASSKKRKESAWIIVNSLMGAGAETYYYLLSGGAAHVLAHVLEDVDSDFSLIERALMTIQRALRDRPAHRRYTQAIFERVGVLSSLRRLAVENALPDINFEPLSFAILHEFYGIDTLQEVRDQLAAEEEERARGKPKPIIIRFNRRQG